MSPVPLAARPIAGLSLVQITEAPVFTTKAPMLIRSPGQTVMSGFWVMMLSGEIVMSKLTSALTHPSLVAVTSIVPVMSLPVLLAGAVKIISPLPEAEIPIEVLSLVHESSEPATLLLSGMLTAVPGQKVWLATAFTTGSGFTVIVKIISPPPQVPSSLTVMMATSGTPLRFAAALKSVMSPVPLAARPIAGLSLVQVTEAPVFTTNAPMLIRSPGQTVISGFWVMMLSGEIVMSKLTTALTHPSLVAVTSIVPVMSLPVLLAGAVKIISPLPEAEIPIEVLSLVHESTEPATLLLSGMLTGVPGQKVWLA